MKDVIIILVLVFLWSVFKTCMHFLERVLKDKDPRVRLMHGFMFISVGFAYGIAFLAVAISVLTHYLDEVNILFKSLRF